MSHVRSGIAVTEEILKWKTFWVVGVGGGDRGMIQIWRLEWMVVVGVEMIDGEVDGLTEVIVEI